MRPRRACLTALLFGLLTGAPTLAIEPLARPDA